MSFDSPVLRTVARFTVPLILVVSADVFLQGHDLPGGGFIAGVLAAAAGATHLLAFGLGPVSRFPWWRLAVVGLLVAVTSGTVPLLLGDTFLDHGIWHFTVPIRGAVEVPTATFFDLGVLLIVIGTLMTVFSELGLEEER